MIKDDADIKDLIKNQKWPEPSVDLKARLYAIPQEPEHVVVVQYHKKHFALLSCFLVIGFLMGLTVGTSFLPASVVQDTKVDEITFSYESTGTLIADHLMDQL